MRNKRDPLEGALAPTNRTLLDAATYPEMNQSDWFWLIGFAVERVLDLEADHVTLWKKFWTAREARLARRCWTCSGNLTTNLSGVCDECERQRGKQSLVRVGNLGGLD